MTQHINIILKLLLVILGLATCGAGISADGVLDRNKYWVSKSLCRFIIGDANTIELIINHQIRKRKNAFHFVISH